MQSSQGYASLAPERRIPHRSTFARSAGPTLLAGNRSARGAPSASLGEVVTHAIADGVLRLMRHDPLVRLDLARREYTKRGSRPDACVRSHLPRSGRSPVGSRAARGSRLAGRRTPLRARRRRAAPDDSRRGPKRLPEANAEGARQVLDALEQHGCSRMPRCSTRSARTATFGLVDRLIAAAQAPALLDAKARRLATKGLPHRACGAHGTRSTRKVDRYHRPHRRRATAVRILAKRCRYAAEASTPSLGKHTGKLARSASELQNALGELDDAVVAEPRWLRTWAAHTNTTAGAIRRESWPHSNAPPRGKPALNGPNTRKQFKAQPQLAKPGPTDATLTSTQVGSMPSQSVIFSALQT